MQKLTRLLVVFLSVLSLALTSVASASAHTTTVHYKYLIGTGILCDLDPSACPAVSMESGGDTIEVTGEGEFDWRPRTVSGGGTLIHRNADGDIVGEGTWKALQLISLDEWGCGGDSFPDDFCGGRAIIRVSIKPKGLDKLYTGYLQVDCTIGDQVPEDAAEGVRLNIIGGPNFNQEVSGFTLFIQD